MVRTIFLIALSTCLLNLTVFGADFTASVKNTQVHLNESFTLSLTLKDASAKDIPDTSELKKHFVVNSLQNATHTSVINGKVSSSITWRLSLIPKTEGVIQIPPMTVNSDEGPLSTQPITLTVLKSAPKGDDVGAIITTKVNNASPYKNEPFIYTALLTSKTPLYNVQTQKLQVDDAIVELIGQPKLEEKIMGGVLQHVVEFAYLITPLKAGALTIPSIVIQGAVPQKNKEQRASFFDDTLDPFSMMLGADRLKAFALMTDPIQLAVQPAIPEVLPWLPARALAIEEQWPSDQSLRVGEPFLRSFLIRAEGLKASQLPHLDDLQTSTFKAYADKPEEQEKVLQGTLYSTRKEQYTLIPQQAGTWVLPEISISWWDSVNKEKKIASLPARTVQVLPGSAINSPPPKEAVVEPAATTVILAAPSAVSYWLYVCIALLALMLAAALLWAFNLQRKLAYLPKKASSQQAEKKKKEKLPDLNPT